MESIDLASLVCLRRSIADCICGSCASLTLVYVQFKFCSSVIYFIKRSRNFGFAGQCFKSSFLFLFVPRTYLPFHFFVLFFCFLVYCHLFFILDYLVFSIIFFSISLNYFLFVLSFWKHIISLFYSSSVAMRVFSSLNTTWMWKFGRKLL